MKCPRCGGTAYAYACEDENGKMPIKCPWCGYSEAQTNEEWFCNLPTEEKAKWLEEKMTWAAQEQGTFTAKGWAKWLKQPHTKEGTK